VSYLLLDAAFLMCPRPLELPVEIRHDAVREYITRLLDLSRLRTTCRSANFLRDEQLTLTLHELGGYPFHSSISEALEFCSDEFDIQVEDANRLANFLIERSTLVEEIGNFHDVVIDEYSVSPVFENQPHTRLFEHLVRAVTLATYALWDGNKLKANTFLASALPTKTQKDLTFNLTVSIAERHDGEIYEPSEKLAVTFPLHKDTASYLKALDVGALLTLGTEHALVDAFVAVAVRAETDPEERAVQIREWLSLGEDFLISASCNGFLHEQGKMQRLARACADVLIGRNQAKSHHLRAGKGANEQQRTRDQWAAWRHDLDDEFHLHYWRSGNQIELANVVVHNNFDITY